MKKYILLLAVCATFQVYAQEEKNMDAFIDGLMSRMTLDDKIGQLNLSGGGVPGVLSGAEGADETVRRGWLGATGMSDMKGLRKLQKIAVEESPAKIPLLIGVDVIHGYKTVFPIPLALSCTWDPQLIERTARIAATEASAEGITWTYSPMLDIARDARWGRIAEGSGEDPWLGAQIARAMVKGYQGDDLTKENTILACLKHFALYGASEAGRDYNTVDMSRIQMFNDYFPPYKAAVEAGCATAMSSFNLVEAVPATGNRWLLTDVLRHQWEFEGFVVSDYNSIGEMTNHGLGDVQTVSALALHAGLDMDMMTNGYITTLKKSLKEGKVTQEEIDQACRRILEAKYKLGLFDDPYRYLDEKRAAREVFKKEHLETARLAAAKSVVLLKNSENILPLKKAGKIAVVGPLADRKAALFGCWCGIDTTHSATIVEAFREYAGNQAEIVYAQGCNLTDDPLLAANTGLTDNAERNKQLTDEALNKVQDSDCIVAVLGEPNNWSGEAHSRSDISLPATQKELLKRLVETGKPVVLVLVNGRPLTLEWEDQHLSAIVEAWHGGTQAARALVDVLFGKVNPSGKLTTTFPRSVGQIPVYYNAKNTGRPMNPNDPFTSKYLDIPNDPLYPFGYGLSYTTFKYGTLQVDRTDLKGEKAVLHASVEVKNTGKVKGEEIVQLYIGDPAASISRPIKELKGCEKITLEPGESKTVTFEITPELLKFYNAQLEYVWEPGAFNIYVGTNSRDVQKMQINWGK